MITKKELNNVLQNEDGKKLHKNNSQAQSKEIQIDSKALNLTHFKKKSSVLAESEIDKVKHFQNNATGKPSEEDLPYPELFDRAERTLAATFAKVGDLNYFTPS